jgi:chromosome partitioning protein
MDHSETSQKEGKIISLSNQKGGIGKTTSAVNLAASLSIKGKKVLICDLDPQGNATSGVGFRKNAELPSIYDVLTGEKKASEAIQATSFEGLDVLPSNIRLAGAEIEMVDLPNRESILKKSLEEIQTQYDYIFIDCPPSLGLLTLNALAASDGVIIPMTCEFYALEGLSQLTLTIRQVKKLYNPNLEIVGILITMYDKRLNLSRQVLSEIQKYYQDKIFATKIARNVRLTEAPSYGMPIAYYDRSSKGSEQYQEIAEELMKRM